MLLSVQFLGATSDQRTFLPLGSSGCRTPKHRLPYFARECGEGTDGDDVPVLLGYAGSSNPSLGVRSLHKGRQYRPQSNDLVHVCLRHWTSGDNGVGQSRHTGWAATAHHLRLLFDLRIGEVLVEGSEGWPDQMVAQGLVAGWFLGEGFLRSRHHRYHHLCGSLSTGRKLDIDQGTKVLGSAHFLIPVEYFDFYPVLPDAPRDLPSSRPGELKTVGRLGWSICDTSNGDLYATRRDMASPDVLSAQ